ncbi:hypothetical protein F441_20197 [Phytophthora nicotianae CJ01A1]|uniref:Uncharacterized protein n=1 Tax=Phytophthora nicotianae CJ01A1 TaxID=1317063 RepID=W2VWW1_PHYNI|nr:hypothetical protein F441_20197 [Phytophthora nicotianae CJ01A1]
MLRSCSVPKLSPYKYNQTSNIVPDPAIRVEKDKCKPTETQGDIREDPAQISLIFRTAMTTVGSLCSTLHRQLVDDEY